ncbi:MAG: redoxin family protein [Planctomycetes bacterium]|nr:redoxin family protein [Planctomycetota bacterium]
MNMYKRFFSGWAIGMSVFVAVLVAGLSGAVANQRPKAGIVGKAAPSWGVTEWINLPEKKTTLDVADFQGKVVYLFCFQSWCPGCHSSGFPTLRTMIDRFKDAEDVAFVAVQTVFEGFSTNTADRAWETAREYKLTIPVGHSGTDNRRSVLMQRYRTGGTPWVVIIDKQGIVRYNAFRITPDRAQKMIDEFRKKETSRPPRSKNQEKE